MVVVEVVVVVALIVRGGAFVGLVRWVMPCNYW